MCPCALYLNHRNVCELLGTQHLRSDIPVPEPMKILPEVMREAGYYTSNNVKTDYNFSHEGRWDESSKEAHWRNRPEGKPFFSVFNFMITHEGPTNALRSTDTSGLKNFHDPKRQYFHPIYRIVLKCVKYGRICMICFPYLTGKLVIY